MPSSLASLAARSMKRSIIIVAGGSGKRMGTEVPKQFLLLNGLPVLCRTLQAFALAAPDAELVLVLPADQQQTWNSLCAEHRFSVPHRITNGGMERWHSVRNGLALVEHDGLVAVHDGVRPLVTKALVEACFEAAARSGAAIPVVPVHASLREVGDAANHAVDRTRYRIVQTPQCFRVPLLRQAFEQPYDPAFTDEASMVERNGTSITLVNGDERNLKITTPTDLELAEQLWRRFSGISAP